MESVEDLAQSGWGLVTPVGLAPDVLEALTGAGLFGMSTSRSALLSPLLSMTYRGHVKYGANKATMRDYVPEAPALVFALPTVLLVGPRCPPERRPLRGS